MLLFAEHPCVLPLASLPHGTIADDGSQEIDTCANVKCVPDSLDRQKSPVKASPSVDVLRPLSHRLKNSRGLAYHRIDGKANPWLQSPEKPHLTT